MKNLEKIAIDSLIVEFGQTKGEIINAAISAKAAVEMAQQNFKQTAGPLLNYAKESGKLLLEDGVSEEAIQYFEQRLSELIKIPFTLRK